MKYIKKYARILEIDILNKTSISMSDVKKAYKNKAKELHPDRNPGIDDS